MFGRLIFATIAFATTGGVVVPFQVWRNQCPTVSPWDEQSAKTTQWGDKAAASSDWDEQDPNVIPGTPCYR